MGVISTARHGEHANAPSPGSPDSNNGLDNNEKHGADGYVDSPVPRMTLRAFVMGTFVSLGGILFGYDTGQISGFQEMDDYLQRFGEPDGSGGYKFSNLRSGLIVGMLSIGTLVGALVAAPIADRFGRKWSITGWCLVLMVGLIVQISSPSGHWYQMVVGRTVTGLGVGSCSLLVPMYQGESAPRHVRGAMISSYQLFVTLGILVAYCINLGTEGLSGTASWRITLGITFVFAIMLAVGMIFFPESPRYDFRHGKVDNARRTMSLLYGVPENHVVILRELSEIKEQLDLELKEQKWNEFFTAPRMAYRIALGVALQALQQLTGANYFFYFGTTVFKGAGISNSFITSVILGAVNFGTTFGGLYIIEHYGRRKSLISGALVMFVCFMIFASVGHFVLDVHHPENTPGAGKGMIVVACIFIAAFAMTWGPMVWAIVAELYPSKYRARGMALATASNWLWNFLLSFFTAYIVADIDFAYGYVFAGCLAVAAAVVYFCVIEGKGRTLEEMDYMYVAKVAPWKSSNYELPPPHEWVTTEQLAEGRAQTGLGVQEDPYVARKEEETRHAENA